MSLGVREVEEFIAAAISDRVVAIPERQ